MQAKKYQIIKIMIVLIVVPLLLWVGISLFDDRKYYLISISIVIVACLPFFLRFEKRKPQSREIMIIAVMAAISVAGRC